MWQALGQYHLLQRRSPEPDIDALITPIHRHIFEALQVLQLGDNLCPSDLHAELAAVLQQILQYRQSLQAHEHEQVESLWAKPIMHLPASNPIATLSRSGIFTLYMLRHLRGGHAMRACSTACRWADTVSSLDCWQRTSLPSKLPLHSHCCIQTKAHQYDSAAAVVCRLLSQFLEQGTSRAPVHTVEGLQLQAQSGSTAAR